MTEHAKQAPPVQFRDRELEPTLEERAQNGETPGLVARRDLSRYYAVLAAELRTLRLTEPEASLICDALNGTLLDETSYRILWAEIDDAILHDGLADKWGVNGPALVARLRTLTPGQAMALTDAVERAWRAPNAPDRLRAVGLIV